MWKIKNRNIIIKPVGTGSGYIHVSLHEQYDNQHNSDYYIPFRTRFADEDLNNLIGLKNKEELSKLEYLIGMRFHACLVSAKAGVKTLGINYDVKWNTWGYPLRQS